MQNAKRRRNDRACSLCSAFGIRHWAFGAADAPIPPDRVSVVSSSVMRLSATMIYVKDLPRMRAFYSDLLALRPTSDMWTDSWTEFDAGGVRFELHAIPPDIASQ